MNIDDEIAELERIRDFANKRLRELKSWKATVSPNAPPRHLWVQTECLTPHIIEALKHESAVSLARRAGVADTTVKKIRDSEYEWTREDIADKLMMAMDLPHIRLEPVAIRNSTPHPPPNKFYED